MAYKHKKSLTADSSLDVSFTGVYAAGNSQATSVGTSGSVPDGLGDGGNGISASQHSGSTSSYICCFLSL